MPQSSSKTYQIVLYNPVIPQNTGAIARLCACTGAKLHLIHPLGFHTDSRSVKRAGLDYWEHVLIEEHKNWDEFVKTQPDTKSFLFFSRKATRSLFEVPLVAPPVLIFGSETNGLPNFIWEQFATQFVTLPMRTHLVRSLNLAQSVAVGLYEAIRQNGGELGPA